MNASEFLTTVHVHVTWVLLGEIGRQGTIPEVVLYTGWSRWRPRLRGYKVKINLAYTAGSLPLLTKRGHHVT